MGSTPLGIGGRWDAQESFSGLFDEVNFYNQALPFEIFQRNLFLLIGDRLALDARNVDSNLLLS